MEELVVRPPCDPLSISPDPSRPLSLCAKSGTFSRKTNSTGCFMLVGVTAKTPRPI